MNYLFNGVEFVENIKRIANETVIIRICEALAGSNEEYGSIRTWQNKFSEWKKDNSKPYADDLMRIAGVYGCSIDDLLGVKPARKSPAAITSFDLLKVVDTLVNSGLAKISISNEGTATNSYLVLPDEDDILEFVKICDIKIYNSKLVDLLDNYNLVSDPSNKSKAKDAARNAIIENERIENISLSSLSPEDITLTYTTMNGKPYTVE